MSVIAFIDRSPSAESVIRHAVWAAQILEQPITLVTLDERDATDPTVVLDAYQGMDAREDVFRELASYAREVDEGRDSEARSYLQESAQRARALGAAQVRTASVSDSLENYISENTDSDDLLVIGKRGDSDAELGTHLEKVLHVPHRTMLIVPETFGPVGSWLLAYDGKAASGECVRYLTRFPLLKDIAGKAVITGNDAHARIHFRDAMHHLRDAGYNVAGHELRGAAEDVIPAVVEVAGIDMLVMGAYGQGRMRSMLDRSTTVRLLRSSRGPILVSRS